MCDKITNRNSYLQNFGQSKQGEALRYAHEIRKFEIDLYWRRAAYFWTFIGVAFAAVFVVEEHKSAAGLRFLVACVGLVFSVAWLQANRGSKYWQENWEQQVDILEDEITGPIYKITANVPERVTRLSLLKPYRLSVSKINQVLSLFVAGIWFILALRTAAAAFRLDSALALLDPGRVFLVFPILVAVATAAALWLLICKTESGGGEATINMKLRKRSDTVVQHVEHHNGERRQISVVRCPLKQIESLARAVRIPDDENRCPLWRLGLAGERRTHDRVGDRS